MQDPARKTGQERRDYLDRLDDVRTRLEKLISGRAGNDAADRTPAAGFPADPEFYRHVLDTVPANVAVLDDAGTIVYVNKPWLDYGLANGVDDVDSIGPGANYFKVCAEPDGSSSDEVRAALKGMMAVLDRSQRTFELEYPCDTATEKRWSLMYVTPFDLPQFRGLVVFHIDITARKRGEQQLSEAKAMADLYVDLMSHDINNMNQVGIGFLELARDSPKLDEAGKELIDRPLSVLKDSSRLIDTVRKLQRVSEGDIRLNPVDVRRMVEESVAGLRYLPGRDVRLVDRVPEDCVVSADGLLKDVFTNIIHNAIKHAPGPVTITVDAERLKGSHSFWQVTVEDNGPGIDAKTKEKLFQRFQRGDTAADGHGLGLYLVRRLVEYYGGRVRVEDRVAGNSGEGARFLIELPAAE